MNEEKIVISDHSSDATSAYTNSSPPSPTKPKNRPNLNKGMIIFLGGMFTITALIQFILQIVTLKNSINNTSHGVGFWSGSVVALVAISCLLIFIKPRNGPAIVNLMLSSIGMVTSTAAIYFSVMEIYWPVDSFMNWVRFEYRCEQIGQMVMSIIALLLCVIDIVFVSMAVFTCCMKNEIKKDFINSDNSSMNPNEPPTYVSTQMA